MEPTSEEHESDKNRKDSISSSSVPKTSSDKKTSDKVDAQSKQKENKRFRFFAKHDTGTKVQIYLAIGTICTLIAYIVVSWFQIHQMSDAIAVADSSNVSTRESVRLQKIAWKYQRERDSLNNIFQNTKDSLFAISQNERDSLNRESFILKNRAYLNFRKITPLNIAVGTKVFFSWEVVNTGKTPAYGVRQNTYWHSSKDFTDEEFEAIKVPSDTGMIVGSGLAWEKTSDNIFIKDSVMLLGVKRTPAYIGIVIKYEDYFHRERRTRAHFMCVNDELIYLRKFNDAN